MKRDQNTGRVQLIGIKRHLTRAVARSVVFAQRSLFRPHTRPSFPPAAFLHHTQPESPRASCCSFFGQCSFIWSCPVPRMDTWSSGWLACAYYGPACPPAVVLASRRPLANGNDKRRVWRITRHSWAKLPDLG